MNKIVNIEPKKNNITSRHYSTIWYKDAEGLESKFLDEIKNAVSKSKFPDIIIEDITIKTGGCMGQWKDEQFEAVQLYSNRDDLKNNRCAFSATQLGNLLHISLYFIQHVTVNPAGCFPLLNLFNSGGGASLKEDDYKHAFENLVWMVFKEAEKNIPLDPVHIEKADRSSTEPQGVAGIMDKFKNFGK